jgi:hypothetical protein
MTTPATTEKRCLVCKTGTSAAPLLRLEYRDSFYWICPQHLPILIHDPGRLVGMLPGAEGLSPAAHPD